jgi:non-heme chloroperoxidase
LISFRTRDGLTLAGDEAGPAGGATVLFLHGGGQTRHSWGNAVDAAAATGCHAITIDLRGHGESDWAKDGRYDLPTIAQDVADVVAALPDRPVLVGASLGGLASLVAVGRDGIAARALVLVDVVPQIEPEGANEIRGFMTANPDGFATIDEAADAVAAYLPHRTRRSDHSGLRKNLRLRVDGRYHWHWDPKLMAPGSLTSPVESRAMLEEAARGVAIPTLLIRGGHSRVVSLEGAAALQALIPQAEFVNIEQADHMVAGDANDAFNAPLLAFLEKLP